jgi:hypothetical protein
MSDREFSIPSGETKPEAPAAAPEKEQDKLTQEEADFIEKVFFEEDETIRLRDGRTYRIPALSLKDGRKLMKQLHTIDATVIISNLIEDEEGNDNFDNLMSVLLMAFRPYYKDIDADYLAEYVDIETAKKIIDIMIGINGLKKSL